MNVCSQLTEEQRRAFVTALLYVATIDERLHPSEDDVLRRTFDAAGLSEADRRATVQVLEQRPQLEDVLAPLRGSPAAKVLVRELVSLAHADGHYAEAERGGVVAVIEYLGLPHEWLKKLEAWVAEGLDWHRRGESLVAGA